jgi:hypothetical protein
MKTKFFLMLLALSGLFWHPNHATAYTTVAPTITDGQIPQLSQTISELIGLDRDTHSLVEFAIDRALIAQKVNDNLRPVVTAGVPISPKQPIITGKIAVPNDASIGQTKIKKTKTPKPQSSGSNNQQPTDNTTRVNPK